MLDVGEQHGEFEPAAGETAAFEQQFPLPPQLTSHRGGGGLLEKTLQFLALLLLLLGPPGPGRGCQGRQGRQRRGRVKPPAAGQAHCRGHHHADGHGQHGDLTAAQCPDPFPQGHPRQHGRHQQSRVQPGRRRPQAQEPTPLEVDQGRQAVGMEFHPRKAQGSARLGAREGHPEAVPQGRRLAADQHQGSPQARLRNPSRQ